MSKVNLYMAEVGSSAAQFIGLIWDGVYNYDDFNLVGDKYMLKSDRAANGSARDMIQPTSAASTTISRGAVSTSMSFSSGRTATT